MPSNSTVSIAQSSLKVEIRGYVTIDISTNEHHYQNQKLAVLNKLCTDVIIGQDILRQVESLTICGLTVVSVLSVLKGIAVLMEPQSLSQT